MKSGSQKIKMEQPNFNLNLDGDDTDFDPEDYNPIQGKKSYFPN